MSWLSDIVGAGLSFAAQQKAGEAYRKGFEDAKNGQGKDPNVIRLKTLNKRRPVATFREAEETLIEAYEEGYRDGIDRDRIDRINSRFL